MDPLTFIGALKSAPQLYSFVRNIGFNQTLDAIGDNHYKTALRLAKQLQRAHDMDATLRTIIGHLEGAHTAYQIQWESGLNKLLARSLLRAAAFEAAWRKDVYTCVLLAIFYTHLKEQAYALSNMNQAKEAYTKGSKVVNMLEPAIENIKRFGRKPSAFYLIIAIAHQFLASAIPSTPSGTTAHFLSSLAISAPDVWKLTKVCVVSSSDLEQIENGVKHLLD